MVKVVSISCVCFKDIFSVHYGECIEVTQNETSDKHKIQYSAQKNLSEISPEKLSFSFASKAIFHVFDLSKWAKTCITTVVFEVALDVQSVKVSEYPFKQNRSMLKIKTAIIYMFL